MKLRNTCTAILSAAVALTAARAGAQTQYINPPNGSLMLCFREVGSLTTEQNNDANGTSNPFDEDLLVTIQNFTSGTINLNSDLTSVFGSAWYSLGTLEWSVLGASTSGHGLPADTLFATAPGSPADAGSSTQQIPARSDITALYTAFHQGTAGAFPGGSSIVDPEAGNSYTQEEGSLSGILDQSFELSGDIGSGGSSTSNIYELYPSNSSPQDINVGTATLNSDGTFVFAVPEPSTWASMIAGVAALLVFSRRRKLA